MKYQDGQHFLMSPECRDMPIQHLVQIDEEQSFAIFRRKFLGAFGCRQRPPGGAQDLQRHLSLVRPTDKLVELVGAHGRRRSAAALLRLVFRPPFRLVDRDHLVDGRDLRLQIGKAAASRGDALPARYACSSTRLKRPSRPRNPPFRGIRSRIKLLVAVDTE